MFIVDNCCVFNN